MTVGFTLFFITAGAWEKPGAAAAARPAVLVTTNSRREILSGMARSYGSAFAVGLGDCRLRSSLASDLYRHHSRRRRTCLRRGDADPPGRARRAVAGRAADLSQARDAPADWIVQDPRRLQRRQKAYAGSAVAGRLDGQRGQRRPGGRARREKGRRALQRDGDGHGTRDEV